MRALLILTLLSGLALAGCTTTEDNPPTTNNSTNTTNTTPPTATPTPTQNCAVPGAPVCVTPPGPGA